MYLLKCHQISVTGKVPSPTESEVHNCYHDVCILCSYYFSVFKLDDFEKAHYAIYMFKDLFGLSRFDSDSLIRFTLTVRKNYRRVPYHNWTHGFSVANSMYSVIKHSQNTFKDNEVSANNRV